MRQMRIQGRLQDKIGIASFLSGVRSSLLRATPIAALLALSLTTAYAQDGRTFLNRTLLSYQTMNSYVGKSVIDLNILLPSGERQPYSAESSAIWYKRPNKLVLKLTSNKSSVEVYSNGKTLTVYHLDSQKYFSVPAPPDMKGMLTALHDRASIDAILDPLFFLSSPSIPPTLRGTQRVSDMKNVPSSYKNVDQIDGHPALNLVCYWRSSGKTIQHNFFMQDEVQWFISIDKTNGHILKTEAHVPGKIMMRVIKKKKVVAMPMKITVVMSHQVAQATPDVNIPDSVFVFTPPKGSTLQTTPDDLVKKANQSSAKSSSGVKF